MEFVYGKRCDDNAQRNGVDPCATFAPMHRLCHDTLFIAALCQLVRMERIPDFFRLEHLQGEQFLCRCFGEQCVLCGGVTALMKAGFDTLVEAGYQPENAYFECIHEMKLIIDLINKGGVAAMNYSISDTAEFGEYVSGPRVLPHEETKARMRAVLADIQDGTFAGRWIAENKSRGRTFFNSKRDQLAKHLMEQVGEELRRNMIWGGDKDLDTASN